MEIAPGIHRIEASLGERYVACYLIVEDDSAVLIDTGIASSPEDAILPYIAELGSSPSIIKVVVTTHADMDHSGGNAAIAKAAPGAQFACHMLDRPMIDDLEAMITDRYGEFEADHGISYGEDFNQWVRDNAAHVNVDLGLRGGEEIRVGRARRLLVLHTPGHSRGHLSVYDEETRSLMIGDAVLSRAVPTSDGRPAIPPTYRYVDSYLASIDRLDALECSQLLTSHYRAFNAEEAADFFAESRAFVEDYDRAIISVLAGADRPMSTQAVMDALPDFGEWPSDQAAYTAFPIVGHLERMGDYGLVDVAKEGGVVTWRWRK